MTRSGTSEKLIIISEKSYEIRRTDLSGDRLWRQAPSPMTPPNMSWTGLRMNSKALWNYLKMLPVATLAQRKRHHQSAFLHMTWDWRVKYFIEGWERWNPLEDSAIITQCSCRVISERFWVGRITWEQGKLLKHVLASQLGLSISCPQMHNGLLWCINTSAPLGKSSLFVFVCAVWICVLTSDIFEVDGLSVGVEELDDGIVIVFDSTAYGGHLSFHYWDVVRYEILALDCGGRERKQDQVGEWTIGRSIHSSIQITSAIYKLYICSSIV